MPRFARSQWFDNLTNEDGLKCSDAGGIKLDDPEWRCKWADGCFVKLDGVWRQIPPDAALDTSNIVGCAMV
jgi:hypothetical protein